MRSMPRAFFALVVGAGILYPIPANAAPNLIEVQGRVRDLQEQATEAAEGAHAVIMLTEWNEFRALDLREMAGRMAVPRMADLRNMYSCDDVLEAGFEAYVAMGRKSHLPQN